MMNRYRIHGFGLVELMIAILLGLMLSAALIQAYVASKSTYRTEDSLSEVQETGRYVLNAMAQDIRLSGQAGCLTLDSLYKQTNPPAGYSPAPPNLGSVIAVSGNVNAANVSYTTSTMITGLDNISTGTSYGTVPVQPNSDVITIGRVSSSGSRLAAQYDGTNSASASASIVVEGSGVAATIKPGATVLIGDCQKVAMFRASSVSVPDPVTGQITIGHQASSGSNTYNSQNQLSVGVAGQYPTFKPAYYYANPYQSAYPGLYGGAALLAFQQNTYFVGDTGRTTATGLHIHALYVTSLSDGGSAMNTSELVSGVEDMQIEYGLTTGQYVNAAHVPNFNLVASVRISLLVKSTADNVVPTNGNGVPNLSFPTVFTNGETTQYAVANDGRLAQQFFSVVAIRSRS